MKRKLTTVIFSAIMLFSFTVTASADMGSKPRVNIKFKNRPNEEFYTDLLYKPKNPDNLHKNINEDNNYNQDMVQLLFSYTDEGWYPAYAGGTEIPMWGDLLCDEDGSITFNYHGVPDCFKIITVTGSGTVKTSQLIERKTMEISLTVDFDDMSIETKPVWMVYLGQFFITCIITLFVELLVLWIFRFNIKENLKVFIITNVFTQIVFTTLFSSAFIYGGTMSSLAVFIPLETAVTLTEMIIYRKLFKGHTEKSRMLYAVTANTITAALTFVNIDRLMDLMFKIMR